MPDVLFKIVFGLLNILKGVPEVYYLGSGFLMRRLYILVCGSVLDDHSETATGCVVGRTA